MANLALTIIMSLTLVISSTSSLLANSSKGTKKANKCGIGFVLTSDGKCVPINKPPDFYE